jgi:hypothetical protein
LLIALKIDHWAIGGVLKIDVVEREIEQQSATDRQGHSFGIRNPQSALDAIISRQSAIQSAIRNSQSAMTAT